MKNSGMAKSAGERSKETAAKISAKKKSESVNKKKKIVKIESVSGIGMKKSSEQRGIIGENQRHQ